MMPILFVQLPPSRFSFVDAPANIPLAAGFLASALDSFVDQPGSAAIVGPEIVDVFADEGLVRIISEHEPVVVAFSLYVWNVQRSLFIASGIKKLVPQVKILVGGPEVTPDNDWVVRHPAVDAGVFGEGESRISDVLQALLGRGDMGHIPGTFFAARTGLQGDADVSEPWDLTDCLYPYLDGRIRESIDGTVFLETVRGCPYRCRYCYYHKAFDEIRYHPSKSIEQVLCWAYGEGSRVREVYLMDPTFNARPGFSDLLRYVRALRKSDYPRLHTELRADLLSEEDAVLLREAGVGSVEIGLQSTNREALRQAGRKGDPQKIERGVSFLKKQGIEVTTGIILGLPGDTPEGFLGTLNWLKRTESYSVIHPFVLSVLPGTDFRAAASELGLDYDRRPPYYVRSTDTFSEMNLRSALLEFEETFDTEIDAIDPSSLVDRGSGVLHRLNRADYVSKWVLNPQKGECEVVLPEIMAKASDPFTMWFRGIGSEDSQRTILDLAARFSRANPHTVVHMIFEFLELPQLSFWDKLLEVSAQPDTFLNRSYQPLYRQGEVVAPQFVIIHHDPHLSRVRSRILEQYSAIATVVWDQVGADKEQLFKAVPPMLISGWESQLDSDSHNLLQSLFDRYPDHTEEILFREHSLQQYWDRLTRGIDPATRFSEKVVVTL
jgi:radical SAM superfamily enzyme YgiQ (UPF0313 family)